MCDRAAIALAIALAAACGSRTATPDAGPVEADAGAPIGSSCGDGVVGAGEACDGDARACETLGSSFAPGAEAPCRSDCAGWDPAPCTRAMPSGVEMVKPALRDPDRWKTARCNDGTPFGFAIRVAATPSPEWMVYLQGGVYCDDLSLSCAERRAMERALTTTPSVPDRTVINRPAFDGLLSDDPAINPDFANANQVLAFYCSSDFWSGAETARRPTTADPAGWYFSGRANVEAMIAILIERYGLDDRNPATRVLFGGGSAGAFGAHLNAARVRELLPFAAADDRLLLFVDAGWMTDWDEPAARIGTATVRDLEVWRAARTFWGARFDPACEAAEAADPARCFFGPVWYPHVASAMPVLVQQSEIDASFMAVHGIDASSPGDTALREAWRAQVVASLAGVDRLFSGSTAYHVLGRTAAGLGTGPPGSTLRDVLGRFWAGAPAERVRF